MATLLYNAIRFDRDRQRFASGFNRKMYQRIPTHQKYKQISEDVTQVKCVQPIKFKSSRTRQQLVLEVGREKIRAAAFALKAQFVTVAIRK